MSSVVRFALVAYFPPEGDLPGLADLGVDDKLAAFRRETTWLFWTGIFAAALFFQLSPILTVRRPFPAVLLSEEQLDTHAHKLATHPSYWIRQIIVLLKLVGGMFWGSSPEIRARMALAPYGDDPGTRRTEPVPETPPLGPRAPSSPLLLLGRAEEARHRGWGHGLPAALDVTHEKEAS